MIQTIRHNLFNSLWLSCLLFLAVGLLTSCSGEDTDTPEETVAEGTLQFTAVGQLGNITRSSSSLASIQLFLVNKVKETGAWDVRKARVNYRNRTSDGGSDYWQSLATVKEQTTYYIFGYMPADAITSTTITTRKDDYSKDYAKGATMTFNDLPPVTTQNICILVGVSPNSSFQEGTFDYYALSSNNTASLLFDHLYAAIDFNVRIDANYAKLRNIKLKSMQVIAAKESVNATIDLKPNIGESPIRSVTFSNSATEGSSSAPIIINEGKGLDLTTEWLSKPIDGFLAPENIISDAGTVKLVTTYNVYDKKGNLLREDCQAVNKLPTLSNLKRGQKTVLKLTVKPTYLYMLSDPDLNNPSVILN